MCYKTDSTKSGEFWFKIQFQNFQKPKIKLKKDPLKFQKSKTYIRRPQIKKFYTTDPPKVEWFKTQFEIFKNKKSNSKKAP